MKQDLFEQLDKVRHMLHHEPRGLAVDVDGTISEIAASPEAAYVSTKFKQHLRTLVRHFDLVAAISGRNARDARNMVGVEGLVYVGNHGLEWWMNGRARLFPGVEPHVVTVARALDEIRGKISFDGVFFENKGPTAAIHFRASREAEPARASVLAAIRESPSAQTLRVAEGKMVIELRPRMRVDKGWALAELVHNHELNSVIYLGDDITDVDAFRTLRKLRSDGHTKGVAVAVLGPETPNEVVANADATLQGIPQVERFLCWLVEDVETHRDTIHADLL